MIREARKKWDKRGDSPFHWRGHEVSRLEGFSDAVFGFALTLLVVSLEVPKSFAELARAMRGFLAFAICFGMLATVWERHYRFFRRFGLQDRTTTWLNSALLFVILFYVYPLKFVMTSFMDELVWGAQSMEIGVAQVAPMFAIYGAGFAATFLVFAALYGYAWRHRDDLELSEAERFLVRAEIQRNFAYVALALVSIGIAYAVPPKASGMAGYVYCVIGVIETWRGRRTRIARERWPEVASEP